MGLVLLARHGETDWNAEGRFQGHADRPLTERGHTQSRLLADRLARAPLAAVYASDLRRARETAEAIAAPHGLDVTLRRDLREVDVGSWSGLTTAEARARFPEAFRRWRKEGRPGWDGGETYEAMRDRAAAAVLEIAGAHAEELVLVVTHGGTIRALRATALGMDVHEYRHLRPGEPHAGLAALRVDDGQLRPADADAVADAPGRVPDA